MNHLLFLYVGQYFAPDSIPAQDLFRLLSTRYTGDIVSIVRFPEHRRVALSSFLLRGLYLPQRLRRDSLLRALILFAVAALTVTFRHWFRKRYAAIVVPEPLVAGPMALMLSWMTGARLVVEINGQFESAFRKESVRLGLMERLKQRYVDVVLPFVVRHADAVRLLYRGQLASSVLDPSSPRIFSFADFVSAGRFGPADAAQPPYILFLGYPWYLKGVDVLIKAFQQVSADFPDHRLKVVGYCQDKTDFRRLAGDNQRIELCDAVWYPQVIELMTRCSLFVLPSRTEAMGRVLLEAMAAQKPIVASRVDGIPAIIRDGANGLLFESENVDDLAAKLRMVLSDPALARRLAENGHRRVRDELSEEHYLTRFSGLIDAVTGAALSPAVGRRAEG